MAMPSSAPDPGERSWKSCCCTGVLMPACQQCQEPQQGLVGGSIGMQSLLPRTKLGAPTAHPREEPTFCCM